MKGIYIVLLHRKAKVRPDEHSHPVWQTFEQCMFVDRLRDKHLQEATAIVDLLNEKVIKLRGEDKNDPDAFGTVVAHVHNHYPEQYKRLLEFVAGNSAENNENKV